MSEDKTILELVSEIDEFIELSNLVQDPDLDEALSLVVKLRSKPEIPAPVAAPLVVKLQALSAMFKIRAKTLVITKAGPDAKERKDAFFTLAEQLDELADAVKYLVRNY